MTKIFERDNIRPMQWLMLGVLFLMYSTVSAQGTRPRTMEVSCDKPNPEAQTGLRRVKGDGNTWLFQISLVGKAKFTKGPIWSYPGKGATTPEWGTWAGGGNGSTSLSWSAPRRTGTFNISATGKIKCGDGNGAGEAGKEIDFSTSWSGEVFEVKMVNPSGDPTKDGEAKEGENEFTFNTSPEGYCYIRCQASISPDSEEAKKWAEENIVWAIDPGIAGSELTWGDFEGGAFVEKDNKGKVVWIRFKGLPTTNDAFGLKTVKMTVAGEEKTNNIEVFFSKYATNHPGGDQLPPNTGFARSPNWFYYWNPILGDPNAYYNGRGLNSTAAVPAMADWSLIMPHSKSEIWINDQSAEDLPNQFNGNITTGIDRFANAIRHEQFHVRQIAQADALLTQNTGIWSKGWAWRSNPNDPALPDNRYNPGPPVVDLDVNNNYVPDAWEPYSIENEASKQETVAEHANWQMDWGSPGKQHARNKNYAD